MKAYLKALHLLLVAVLGVLPARAADDPEKARAAAATTALDMVKSLDKEDGPGFLKNHGAFNKELLKLKQVAEEILAAKGTTNPAQKLNFATAVKQVHALAEEISTRPTEKAPAKKKAKDAALRLKILL